ncbi:MAG: hypothetical protein AAGK32_20305, partial [Actinomycetota bacterium]
LEHDRRVPPAAVLVHPSQPTVAVAVAGVDDLDRLDRVGQRRVHQHRRWWDPTIMLERTQDVAHHRSVRAVVHHHRADVTHEWTLRLVPGPAGGSRLTLDESVDVAEGRYPGEARLLSDRLLRLRPELLAAIADGR